MFSKSVTFLLRVFVGVRLWSFRKLKKAGMRNYRLVAEKNADKALNAITNRKGRKHDRFLIEVRIFLGQQ